MTSGKPVALVTGGAGFIGSHMVDHLLVRDYRVRVIDDLSGGREQNLSQHSDDPCLDVEIRDIRTVKHDDPMFSDVKLVFHFAGIGDIVLPQRARCGFPFPEYRRGGFSGPFWTVLDCYKPVIRVPGAARRAPTCCANPGGTY